MELLNVAAAGALEGVDCTALLSGALANGAPGLYYPPGNWVQNDLELMPPGRSRIAVRGAGPAATRITTSLPGKGVFTCTATVEQESFVQIEDLELCNGPAYPSNGQAGLGIAIKGPPGGEIGKGLYRNLWFKNFWAAIYGERHNNASVVDVTAEYCASALYAVDCGDLEAARVKAQNGTGWAIELHGTDDGVAAHRAEGARLIGCSSNTQFAGLLAQNFSFLHVAGSSFSTAPAGALYLDNVSESSVTGGEWQAGPNVTAIRVMANCKRNRLIGVYAYDSLQGLSLAGEHHTVVGLHADGNAGLDVDLRATGTAFCGGQLLSTGAAQSLLEFADPTIPARNNRITGMITARGVQLIAGAGSVAN